MKDLTEKQEQILLFVIKSIQERGVSPTVREVGDHVGLTSSSTVHKHLNNLVEKGYLEKNEHSPRTLRLPKNDSPEVNITKRLIAMDDDVSDIIRVEGQCFYVRRATPEDIEEWIGEEGLAQ
ncbi:repressor LexA [Halobacillus karajensis]|uniref:LexA family protein n=1 Tax=Halobacillus karajensis TaxID=195088 RepID=UPI0008A75239|nr:helix-turn-helix domain-containing protein [Halobacillus karajensis]SEH77956.1 repressor LexA [Halobacillus karajensis]